MDNDEYEGLIKRLEAKAENNPATFRTTVFLLSITSYLVLLLMFAAAGLILYAAITIPDRIHYVLIAGIAISVIPALYVTARAFFTRLSPPSGVEVTAETAPALFKVLAKMRKKLNGPAFHRVVIDHDFNAAISQVPRFGLFGGYRNHLVLGLPYLYGVTAEEMLATIAHEYGHVAGNHGKLGAWVYRQRITFGDVQEHAKETAEDSWFNTVLYKMITYAAPYINAYTFVLSRQNEYEADNTATEIIGAKPNASGLIRGDLLGNWIHEEFWPKLYKQAQSSPTPLFKPYSAMKLAFASSMNVWSTEEKLQAVWRIPSGLSDTHPALSDRVIAIGEKPVLPEPVKVCAADRILGKLAGKLAMQFDAEWWKDERPKWQDYHQRYTKAKVKIDQLSATPMQGLSVQDLQELAFLKLEFDSGAAAKPILAHMLSRQGGPYSKAEFEYGCILINEGNGNGLTHLTNAAKADKTLRESAGEVGYYYLLRTKNEEVAGDWWAEIVNAD